MKRFMKQSIVMMALMLLSSVTYAEAVIQNDVACRNEKALGEYQTARMSGDQATMDWLISGTACLIVAKNTAVDVMDASGNFRKIRTLGLRRNLTLWIDSTSVGDDSGLN